MQRKISASVFDNVADFLQQLDLFTAEEFLEAYNQSLIKLLLDNGADIDGEFAGALSEGRPRTALEHACFRVSLNWTSHVFWNAAFLLHGGADGSLNTETGNSALDWLLRAWLSDSEHYLPSPVSWGRQFYWDVLAVLLLKHNPAPAYINKPISDKALKLACIRSLTLALTIGGNSSYCLITAPKSIVEICAAGRPYTTWSHALQTSINQICMTCLECSLPTARILQHRTHSVKHRCIGQVL